MNLPWQQAEIDNCLQNAEKQHIAPPRIISGWGSTKRAECEVCGSKTTLRGYSAHFKRAHTNRTAKTARGAVSDEDLIERFNATDWMKQHRDSMRRLLKRSK